MPHTMPDHARPITLALTTMKGRELTYAFYGETQGRTLCIDSACFAAIGERIEFDGERDFAEFAGAFRNAHTGDAHTLESFYALLIAASEGRYDTITL